MGAPGCKRSVGGPGGRREALRPPWPPSEAHLPGLTQFVETGKTGWVVPVEPSLDARFEAIDAVRARLPEMEVACRRAYEETFDSRCVLPHVAWIVGAATRAG